jgi:hypothetical protein
MSCFASSRCAARPLRASSALHREPRPRGFLPPSGLLYEFRSPGGDLVASVPRPCCIGPRGLLYEFPPRARSPGYLPADGIEAMPRKPLKNKVFRAVARGVTLAPRGCAPRNRLRPIPHRWNFNLTINRPRPSAQRKRPEAAKSGPWWLFRRVGRWPPLAPGEIIALGGLLCDRRAGRTDDSGGLARREACHQQISAPQRGVKGATAPTAPKERTAPAEAGEDSPRGNCVPPCRATASPSHRTRPPSGPAAPKTAIRRFWLPHWAIQKEKTRPRCAWRKKAARPQRLRQGL